ncbi:diacylglycerol kinase family lipid kinase [Alkalihalobacillus sp. MEB130]|uniref:diacylglycerol/lipid kinase family protein n=1 Tax=Alkalihalobacillus sp. MEB130 TaxID=2976704 RepID=UPI0028E03BCE|nr:diacylglycerol kinase family lipid kinase [Alkalihalobacillus sp. MEB130]MDT8859647.1 diacylglycerol kinase family lipid kinase [Alkalihalobacillus sp. MEB130]
MYYFLVNRTSGKGRSVKIWNEIEEILKEKKVSYQVIITETKEEGLAFLHDLIHSDKNISGIVALGGDGTIHEIMNQLIGTTVPFSVIPTGSGNDYARARGISKDYVKEIEKLLQNDQKKIDLLEIGDRHCMTVVGIGFDAKVADEANRMKWKKWFGGLAYILTIFKVLLTYKPSSVKLTINHEERLFEKVWLIAIANHAYYGGGIKICPNASSDDGKLDLCIIHSLPKWRLLFILANVFEGKHVSMNGVDYLQVESIQVDSDEPLFVTADGEMMGQTPTSISVKKSAFHVIS